MTRSFSVLRLVFRSFYETSLMFEHTDGRVMMYSNFYHRYMVINARINDSHGHHKSRRPVVRQSPSDGQPIENR